MRTVAVIGGGASGMMAAITAASEGACVILLEQKDRIGKKIRKNVIGIMYDAFDESIDEASKRVPGWMEKLNSIEQ